MSKTPTAKPIMDVERAWDMVCEHYGIPRGADSKTAGDALFGFGILCQSRGKRKSGESGGGSGFESSSPGSVPGEFYGAKGHLESICVRSPGSHGQPEIRSGLVLRYEQRLGRAVPVETVGGIAVGESPAAKVMHELRVARRNGSPVLVAKRQDAAPNG